MAKKKRRPARKGPIASVATPSTRILIAVVAFYVAVLVTMVVSNRYTFLMKSLVVPVLLLAALFSGRFKRFVNEWAVFLGAVVFFDFARGLAFALTSHFELPMYLDYVLQWERWLWGGVIGPAVAQQWRAGLADPAWLDRFFILVYSSHYLFFLVFGFVIWQRRRAAFPTYAVALTALMYGSLIFYFVVPTIPPWLAANDFLVLPPLEQIVRTFYNIHSPKLLAAFDVNPIAAMPSLHCALPATCALTALRYFGRPGWAAVIYTLAVSTAVVYLGEHYVVDVIAGYLLAVVVHTGVVCWGVSPASAAEAPRDPPEDRWAVRPIVISLALVAAAYGFGHLNVHWFGPVPITRDFVVRELAGRSRLAHYYLGRIAFEEGSFAEAADELKRALDDLPAPEAQEVIRTHLAASAFEIGDMRLAIAALEPLRPVTGDVTNLVMLGNAYVQNHENEKGLAVLREARARFPAEPEPRYWLGRHQHKSRDAEQDHVGMDSGALRRDLNGKAEASAPIAHAEVGGGPP